jgi:hypothetical protein
MLQRAFFLIRDRINIEQLVTSTEQPMIDQLQAASHNSPASILLDGIFGPTRQLYKRLAQYSHYEEPELYQRMARRPYPELARFAGQIGTRLSVLIRGPVEPHEVLVDAPPTKLEVDFNIDVYFAKQNVYRRLGDISPVVRTLAQEQFDNYVKRVRIFVHPRVAASLRALPQLARQLTEIIREVGS